MTWTVLVVVADPPEFVTVSVTVYESRGERVAGVALGVVAPSPKFHAHVEPGETLRDASVNCTICPALGAVGEKEKSATGTGGRTTTWRVTSSRPPPFSTTSRTV